MKPLRIAPWPGRGRGREPYWVRTFLARPYQPPRKDAEPPLIERLWQDTHSHRAVP